MKKFEILSQKMLIEEPYCKIEKQRVRLPDASETDWYVSLSGDAVIVVPMLKTGEVLLQKTYKHGCGEVIYEFPAGMIDSGESPEQAAKRELMEETGYASEQWEYLGEAFSNPTGARMKHIYYLAQKSVWIRDPEPEPAEQIEIVLVKDLSAARALLLSREYQTSNGTFVGLQFAEQFLGSHK